MTYIIHRIDQGGGYVAPPGYRKAYVLNKRLARQFPTREDAEQDRCSMNEVVEEMRV